MPKHPLFTFSVAIVFSLLPSTQFPTKQHTFRTMPKYASKHSQGKKKKSKVLSAAMRQKAKEDEEAKEELREEKKAAREVKRAAKAAERAAKKGGNKDAEDVMVKGDMQELPGNEKGGEDDSDAREPR